MLIPHPPYCSLNPTPEGWVLEEEEKLDFKLNGVPTTHSNLSSPQGEHALPAYFTEGLHMLKII